MRVNDAPKLNGVLDDDVWAKARPVYVQTQQGASRRPSRPTDGISAPPASTSRT
jgi:hypothetical protein